MLRAYKVCVEASTPPYAPLVERLELPSGILTRIEIRIPPGHFGLTGIRIKYGLETILPYRQDEWIIGDNELVADSPQIRLEHEPTEITVEAYNNDDTYEHCFFLRFQVQEESKLTSEILKKFLRYIGLRGV